MRDGNYYFYDVSNECISYPIILKLTREIFIYYFEDGKLFMKILSSIRFLLKQTTPILMKFYLNLF